MMKFLFLLLLLISHYCFALSPKVLRCSLGHDCFNRHLTPLARMEDEIYQSLNTQLFPDLFRYDPLAVSFCDHENKHCITPAIFLYQQMDTGEKLLVVESYNTERHQIMFLLNQQWQKERFYFATGAFFTGYRLSDIALEIRYLRCSRTNCREQAQVMDRQQVQHEY